ncbi:DUF6580 family putative transport protein [Stratiformator vulcanicus]|uniref:Uncharacterized protein n=1 Tax=Stratiformator vulcanicus TaxID=2527980 RepID=A0A517R3E9_9PLAN|nr:DUF6580 family putative transport protein [Stratiformator vulcanicus]QDT38412.1 hypothetical protein Pan189_28060 [Stratiformator vulcanicus]
MNFDQPSQTVRWPVVAAIAAMAVLLRILPYLLGKFGGLSIDPETTTYPWNFSPILPLALFGGAMLSHRGLGIGLTFALWFVGDCLIALIYGPEMGFYSSQIFVYASMLLVVMLGWTLKPGQCTWVGVFGRGLAGAVAFFMLTNFATWVLAEWSTYPMTLAGLVKCYVAAIPFFRNSLVAMAVYLPVLFWFAVAPEQRPNFALPSLRRVHA